MAPIPDENQKNKAPQESEEEELSNPNLAVNLAASDSSADEGVNEDLAPASGYTLLAQEPGDATDSDSDSSEDEEPELQPGDQNPVLFAGDSAVDRETQLVNGVLPPVVLASEAGAWAPTAPVCQSSMHPAFLAQFPDGKVPAYMQVPEMPQPKGQQLLWNQKTADSNKLSLAPEQKKSILQAMSGFQLPQENVPDWARNLSESQWQQLLLQRITATPSHAQPRPATPSHAHTHGHTQAPWQRQESNTAQAPQEVGQSNTARAPQEVGQSNTAAVHTDTAACQEPWVAEFPES